MASDTTRLVTAAEYYYGLSYPKEARYSYNFLLMSPQGARNVREDSLLDAIPRHLQGWLQQLHRTKVTGMQLEFLARLEARAKNPDDAQRIIEERLRDPSLSVVDRACTLYAAADMFSNALHPELFPVARKYLQQLDALPTSVQAYKFRGHITLAIQQYFAGKGPDVSAEVTRAYALAPNIPFLERYESAALGVGIQQYATVESGLPGGHERIRALAERVFQLSSPPAELLRSKDSAEYRALGAEWHESFQQEMAKVAYIGKPALPIVATHWYNTIAPTTPAPAAALKMAPNATMQRLDDGIIRVIEYGHFTCGPCMEALPMMDSLRKVMPPGVEVWLVTYSEGEWGGHLASPDVEAANVAHWIVDRKKIHIPIAMWAPVRDTLNVYGRYDMTAYQSMGAPEFAVIDGQGRLRQFATIPGAGPRKQMEILRDAVEYLRKEQSSLTAAR